jgi:hypothetical protein
LHFWISSTNFGIFLAFQHHFLAPIIFLDFFRIYIFVFSHFCVGTQKWVTTRKIKLQVWRGLAVWEVAGGVCRRWMQVVVAVFDFLGLSLMQQVSLL